MTDGTIPMGGNSEAELKRRIDRRVDVLDQVAELAEEMKGFKAEDKAEGFNERAIADAVKLKRADPDKVLATLMLEAEKAVYRRVAGVPVEIAEAQKAAAVHAGNVPEAKSAKKRGSRK